MGFSMKVVKPHCCRTEPGTRSLSERQAMLAWTQHDVKAAF